MAQDLNLSITGRYTSMSDFNGLPAGAQEVLMNMESPFKNIAVPRNGFERIKNLSDETVYILRGVNFSYGEINRNFALRSDGKVYYAQGDLTIQDITYIALASSANGLSVEYVDGPLLVSVEEKKITVQFENGVSTVSAIATAVNSHAVAKELVRAVFNPTDATDPQNSPEEEAYLENRWIQLPGFSDLVLPPDPILAKSRFLRAAQNLYLSTQGGVRSLAPTLNAPMLRAGVPKGLSLEGEVNDDLIGFLESNTVFFLLPGSNVLTNNISAAPFNPPNGTAIFLQYSYISPFSGVIYSVLTQIPPQLEVGMFVGGWIAASLQVQDILYGSKIFTGNDITIEYEDGSAGPPVVTVVDRAIKVTFESGVSTVGAIANAINASPEASQLVLPIYDIADIAVAQTAPVSATPLAGGDEDAYDPDTRIESIIQGQPNFYFEGDITVGSFDIENVSDVSSLFEGNLISGNGIPENSRISSISGGGPYTLTFINPTNTSATQTITGNTIFTLSEALIVLNKTPPTVNINTYFYRGSQVRYRAVFGRVEEGTGGVRTTKLGAPSQSTVVINTLYHSTNTTIRATLPKATIDEINFIQLYRSFQTASATISPLDQEQLVYERNLVAEDFTNRVVTIEDKRPQDLMGVSLYTGSDQEGIGQANDPPPACWDMCKFRDFNLYANIRKPQTLRITIVGVGAPDGIQVGDEITIEGTYLDVPFSQTFIAAANENAANHEFEVFTAGTVSQNINDTMNSLIRVVNFDETIPIHAIPISDEDDLPGQFLLEADDPGVSQFTVDADDHQTAYDPPLNEVTSSAIQEVNVISLSKFGELDAVPALNTIRVGDSSSKILRVVPLRDFVFIVKEDGIFKGQGASPSSFSVTPFDETTRIIGPDTAVALNSVMYMFSNQGVVTADDSGIHARSIPIDDELDTLAGTFKNEIVKNAFAVGDESRRKYILSVPTDTSGTNNIQYVFNYITNTWSNWNRKLITAYINNFEDCLYIGRIDDVSLGVENFGLSRQKVSGNYIDFIDESFDREIISKVSDYILELDDISNILPGDIIQVGSLMRSMVISVDHFHKQITLNNNLEWEPGPCEILSAIDCTISWKEFFAQNPAFQRQFNEGMLLFKKASFFNATMSFMTDYFPSSESLSIPGYPRNQWGLSPWGVLPWGGAFFPKAIRFLIPAKTQYGSYLRPTLNIRQGYSDFILQGISISYNNISQEVGRQR